MNQMINQISSRKVNKLIDHQSHDVVHEKIPLSGKHSVGISQYGLFEAVLQC